jgi:hypothetical protein
MREAALEHLHRWLVDARDPDPEQRRWKQAYGEGAVLAYERIGVLAAEEAERWRARFSYPGDVESSSVDEGARAAAERHLEALLARVVPMRREPDPHDVEVAAECSIAIAALHAAGVLDDAADRRWRTRLLGLEAPWIDDPEPPPRGVIYGYHVPPEDEEEAARDAEAEAAQAAYPERAEVRDVLIGSPERHDDLAIVALVVHEDSVALHFHFLGDDVEPHAGGYSLEPFREAVEKLAAPALRDGRGTRYEPVKDEAVSASGAGGMAGVERREAISGHWLYTPAPPADARAFTAVLGALRWELTEAG